MTHSQPMGCAAVRVGRRPAAAVRAFAATLAFASWSLGCSLPIQRTGDHTRLVEEFRRAAPIEKTNVGEVAWQSELIVAARAGVATVRARARMDVMTLQYADEPAPRPLYRYVDYSNPIALKRTGDTLYVHWSETLIRSTHWLLAYDLAARREIERRRVRPEDVIDAHASQPR